MEASKETKCPVCGESKFNYVTTCTDYFTTKEKFDIASCLNCGLRITANTPTPEKIGAYYLSKEYISHSNTRKGFINHAYHWIRKYMLNKKFKLVQKQSKKIKGNILDYGAGTGLFVNILLKNKWSAIGFEISEQARTNAKDWYQLELKNNNCWDEIADKSLDVITLWHVMEHVEDLDELWSMFNQKLGNKGTLIVALPNYESFDAHKYGAEWAAYDVPRHLWHFNEASFRLLANNNKFKVKNIKKMPFDGFYISMMSEKNRGKRLHLARGFVYGLIGFIQSLFNKNKSSSLIYILEKDCE